MQEKERWGENTDLGRQEMMRVDKPSRISTRVATCVDDTAGGERKGEMERDIASSGMRGV